MTKTCLPMQRACFLPCPTYCGVEQQQNRLVGARQNNKQISGLTAWQGQTDEAGQKVQTSSCEINT